MDFCPKCNCSQIHGPVYVKNAFGQERLRYTCNRCGYSQTTPTKDANKKGSSCTVQREPKIEWNKKIRDSVDSLLEQAGYTKDASARHQLSLMDFDAPPLPAAPEGMQLVPKEPTPEMIRAAQDVERNGRWKWHEEIKKRYKAMLAAAPTGAGTLLEKLK